MRLRIDSVANGGAGVARADDGRVVFVEGALPGEEVEAEVRRDRRRFLEAVVEVVHVASPARVEPACPFVAAGCGGCDFFHATPAFQREAKETMVHDALQRIGRLSAPEVGSAPELAPLGYRTSVRCLVEEGRAAFRRRASHEAVIVDECMVAHPLVAELIVEGRFGAAREVTLRVGARTGERLVVAEPTAEGIVVPDDVVVIGLDELRAGRTAALHEEVAGRTWRISARSFFQPRPDGADQLVDVVRDGLGTEATTVVDLYGGVGLLSGSVVEGSAVVVEGDAGAAEDARHNLADRAASVIASDVGQWSATPADAVIADPPRTGLGVAVVETIAATGAGRVVLVSCDAGSLGRDAGLLEAAGYPHLGSTLVDLFPQTAHVEVVSVFGRVGV